MFLFIYLFILFIYFIFFYPSPASTDPEWNEIVFSPAIPGLHGYQSEMEKYTHTHTQSDEDEREMGEKGVERGEMRGWQSRDFSATRYDQYFSILHSIRAAQKQFSVSLHSGRDKKKKRKTSFSPILSHSGFIFTFPHRWPLATMIVSYYH